MQDRVSDHLHLARPSVAGVNLDRAVLGVQRARLIVAGEGSALQVQMAGNAQQAKVAAKTLHSGEVLWVNAGEKLAILASGENENKVTHFCILSFKDNSAKP